MPRNSKKLVNKFLAVLLLAGPGTVLGPIVTTPAYSYTREEVHVV